MKSILALFTFSVLGFAEVVNPGASFLAHIADGGGITMDITLVNLDDIPNSYTLYLYADDGSLLRLATDAGTANTFTGTLPGHASFTIHTSGASATAVSGWAGLATSGTIGGSVVFRVNTPPWSGSQTMLPFDSSKGYRFSLAFDNTGSNTTGLAIANYLSSAIPVTVTFKNENGTVIASNTFSLGPLAHQAIVTTSAYPATAGQKGTVEILTTASGMTVLGLNFGPTAVSSILPLVSSSWVQAAAPTDPGNPYDPYGYVRVGGAPK